MAIKRNDFALRLTDKATRNRIIGTTIYPTIEVRDTDLYVYSRQHDRLDLLANKYYGTSRLWWVIAQANRLGEGNFIVKPGIRLRIPQDIQAVLQKLEKINKER